MMFNEKEIAMQKISPFQIVSFFLFMSWLTLTSCVASPTHVFSTEPPSIEENATDVIPTLLPTPNAVPSQAASSTPTATSEENLPLTPTTAPTQNVSVPNRWLTYINDGTHTVNIIRADGRGVQVIVDSVGFPSSPVWSPDGQWIAFVGFPARETDTWLYTVHPDGTGLQQITSINRFKDTISWSPDGSAIVFSQEVTKINNEVSHDLFLLDFITRDIVQLTDTSTAIEIYAEYSPDGKMLAFTLRPADSSIQVYQLMLMDVNTGSVMPILESITDIRSFAWSPDGAEMIVSAGIKCRDLYLVNLSNLEKRQLTDDPDENYYPAWSPEQDWVAFTKTPCSESGTYGVAGSQIYLAHLSGNITKPLASQLPGDKMDPAWSPTLALAIGQEFTITELGANLNLRPLPSLSGDITSKLLEGELILVLEGPVEADGYLWWRISVEATGEEGWVAENPGWFLMARETDS